MQTSRVILIGNTLGLTHLSAVLSASSTPVEVVGLITPGGAAKPHAIAAPVLGDLPDLERCLAQKKIDQALICLPLAMSGTIRDLIRRLQSMAVTWRFLPTLTDQLSGRVRVNLAPFDAPQGNPGIELAMPPFVTDPVQLLDRRPHPINADMIRHAIHGRTVLITGAGGSIGSEIARQVGRFAPGRLILVERAENAMFEIDRQIGELYTQVPRMSRLHDITDSLATDKLLADCKPDVIFHAAAHKHVSVMENHPAQAVDNNVYGTRSIADAAVRHATAVFVMISTDKAVNPRSIMGATKRLAELYIQMLGRNQRRTRFGIVRFGNVLGSNASVLPIWTQQLLKGGPITVTHPDMTRYFMTIPEAAGLVLQSCAIAAAANNDNGEIYLLDMGRPIRILDLAKRFIRAQGFEPEVDVKIDVTGPRPGEKLFEELVYSGENMLPTSHESIRVWRTRPPDKTAVLRTLETLDTMRSNPGGAGDWINTPRQIIADALRSAIPEMALSVND